MLKINMVILDDDVMFLNQFSRYLLDKTDKFTISSFSEKEKFADYTTHNKIDLILFSESFQDCIEEGLRAAKILMTEGYENYNTKYQTINKYQKAEDFLNALLMAYAEYTGNSSVVLSSDKNSYMIGFYSPVGGGGKTTLSAAMAKMLAGGGSKVLYLNFESLSSFSEIFNDKTDKGFLDIMLAAKRKDGNLSFKILTNTVKETASNIYYINPPESAVEYSEMTDEELLLIIKELKAMNEFDYVVADFSGSFDRRTFGMLELCKKIIFPTVKGDFAAQKLKLFIKEMRLLGYEKSILKKTCFVLNRAEARESLDFPDREFKSMTIEENEKYSRMGDILSSNEYNDDIGRLIALIRD